MSSSNPSTTPSRSLSKLLLTGNPIILDGALATHLETLGADISTSLWSARLLLTNPSLIHSTHLSYFQSGAQIATTASYQASIPGLTTHLKCTEPEALSLIAKSVTLASTARSEYLSSLPPALQQQNKDELLVAGSIGPYGAYLANGSEYTGAYSSSTSLPSFKAFHRQRIAAVLSAGADCLALETIPSYPETAALVQLLADEFPRAEAWIAFTLKDEECISDGTALSEVCALVDKSPQILAVGVNCLEQGLALSAVRRLKSLTCKPLVVYPNSGEEWDAAGRVWKGDRKEGERLREQTVEYWKAGARIVGGCCRMGPEDIRVVAETLREVGKE
ncbi:homocysteine S-methyltransferase [Amniculicola lignicola CBS 123094]|uniref:Homocysteine S-methyltransferase n=1 Tax=Amniculicola lignicola CBS 123094 TaxID=1392246 RepID=A0A6A5WTY5_9PLEO|nr:homocysteine S-methyltransferase [Amniculicola lignicola CBS 123094]